MCQVCQVTCCQFCAWPEGSQTSQCTYFRNNSGCPKCKGCPISYHTRSNNLIKRIDYEETITIDYKKNLYEEGFKGAKIFTD